MKRFQTRTLLLLGFALAILGAVAVISVMHALRHFEGERYVCTEDGCWSQRHFPSSERQQACAQRFAFDLADGTSGEFSNTLGLADELHAKNFTQCRANWPLSVCGFLYLELCNNENYRPYHVYHNRQLPDSQYIGLAFRFAKLTRSFTPQNARKQFAEVKHYLWEPAVSKYEAALARLPPEDIETKQLSQEFSVNERRIKVYRYPELERVIVHIPGIVETTPADISCRQGTFFVHMAQTRDSSNEFGIVITDFEWKCES